MRKIALLFVSALTLGLSFTSCNKDDDSSDSSGTITGRWYYSKEGTSVDGTEVMVDYSGNESGCSKDYMTFNSGGTVVVTDYDSFDAPCEVFTSNGTWSKEGNYVTVNFEGEAKTYEILILNSSMLKVRSVSGEVEIYEMTRS
ncbi:lipocalin family protein [Flavobacterium pedocola]